MANDPLLNIDVGPKKARKSTVVLALLIPGILVVALLFTLISLRGGIENAMVHLADLLPVGYAFAAGMVASVNPCGVLMLPNYALYHLGREGDDRDLMRRIFKGLSISLVATAGFVVVFGVVGGVITAGGKWLVDIFPWAGVLIGVAMLGLGIYLLVTHKTFGIVAAGRLRVTPRQNLGNMFIFGVVYAVGSLSCTLPIFLVVIGSALASGDVVSSISQFIGYALGMGTVIFILTVGIAIFQKAASRWFDKFTPYVHRFSAFFLVGAGVYLLYYWIFVAGL